MPQYHMTVNMYIGKSKLREGTIMLNQTQRKRWYNIEKVLFSLFRNWSKTRVINYKVPPLLCKKGRRTSDIGHWKIGHWTLDIGYWTWDTEHQVLRKLDSDKLGHWEIRTVRKLDVVIIRHCCSQFVATYFWLFTFWMTNVRFFHYPMSKKCGSATFMGDTGHWPQIWLCNRGGEGTL